MGWILLITFAKKYFRFVIISKRPQIWKDLLDIEFKQILRHLEQRHLKRRHYILATTTNHKKASMTFKTFNISSPPHFAAWNKYILTWSDCLRATFFHKHIKLNLVLKPLKFKHVWYKEKILRDVFSYFIFWPHSSAAASVHAQQTPDNDGHNNHNGDGIAMIMTIMTINQWRHDSDENDDDDTLE